ncbi:unnamed protein product [Closterium sp. NIES-65]|nr:unnamed protein product [Closterium sp. NIES-65]
MAPIWGSIGVDGLGPIPESEFTIYFPLTDLQSGYQVISAVLEAVLKLWKDEILAPSFASASPGDWFIPHSDLCYAPSLILQTTSFTPPFSVSATLHRVLPNEFFERTPLGSGIFHIKDVVAVHIRGDWVAGPFYTGAGFGARLEILRNGVPWLSAFPQLLYTRHPFNQDSRWIHALSSPLPIALPDLSHAFLREQPSLQHDSPPDAIYAATAACRLTYQNHCASGG